MTIVRSWLLGVFITLPVSMTVLADTSPSDDCEAECLTQLAEAFISDASAGKFAAIALAEGAEVRQNGKPIALADSGWSGIEAVRSSMVFVDATSANVLIRAGVELLDGKPAYLSTRLRRAPGGKLTDVEIASDRSERVVADYVWNLDPEFSAVIAPEQRSSRVELEALVRRYFNSLGTHVAVESDFDDAVCNRFHSGTQITNVASNVVEGGAMLSCVSSVNGDRPWGPATGQRVPVIDVERGIVVGITLLHYLNNPGQPTMYVTEVFKVVGGKIVQIDNIGLMQGNMSTLGFVH